MQSRLIANIALVSACTLLIRGTSHAQGYSAIVTNQKAGQLNGVVHHGERAGPQTVIKDVSIAECSADFKECVTLTKSDKDGKFAVHSNQKGKIHYLKFLSPGWCVGEVTVTLIPGSKTLDIQSVIAA